MNNIALLILILAGGVAALIAVRQSRKNWEEKVGKPSAKEKWVSFSIFIAWCVADLLLIASKSVAMIVIAALFLAGLVPLARAKKGLVKDVCDMGLLAFAVSVPVGLVVFGG